MDRYYYYRYRIFLHMLFRNRRQNRKGRRPSRRRDSGCTNRASITWYSFGHKTLVGEVVIVRRFSSIQTLERPN